MQFTQRHLISTQKSGLRWTDKGQAVMISVRRHKGIFFNVMMRSFHILLFSYQELIFAEQTRYRGVLTSMQGPSHKIPAVSNIRFLHFYLDFVLEYCVFWILLLSCADPWPLTVCTERCILTYQGSYSHALLMHFIQSSF